VVLTHRFVGRGHRPALAGIPPQIRPGTHFPAVQANPRLDRPEDTAENRHFLLLYDRLPHGTGYLGRLTDPEAFRQVLEGARRLLVECPCNGEGGQTCHRCLYLYADEQYIECVSRQAALEILDEPLGTDTDAWDTKMVGNTDQIGLDGQVESDLEARFLKALRGWAGQRGDAVADTIRHLNNRAHLPEVDN